MYNFTKMCLFMALFFSWAVGYGQDTDDTAVPQVGAISFSSQTVNVSTGDVTVSMFIEVTDNRSGAKNVLPDLIYPNGKRESCVAALISGTRTNGTWRYDFKIPQYMQAGTARMDIYLTDEALNHTFLTSTQLQTSGFDPDFEIVNSNPDGVAPSITNISLSSQMVDISSGDGTITISVDVADNLSGTEVVIPNLILPNGMAINGNAQLVSGNAINGRWEKTFIIPQHTPIGTASFGLFMEDAVYNGITFDPAGITSGGFDNDFEITGGTADVAAPQVTSFSVSTESVNVENGNALVSVLVGTTDNLSGVQQVIPHLTTPNGVISSNGATLISGDENNGLWRYTFTVPQYTSDGIGTFDLTVKDAVNNCADLSFEDLDGMGFVASFEINPRNDSLPITLVNFNAKNELGKVLLTWKVTAATTAFAFNVEHSTDGRNFTKIGAVGEGKATAAIQHFDFVHQYPAKGRNYYRLQQVEETGANSYSDVINALIQQEVANIYPNPTSGWVRVATEVDFIEVLNLQGHSLLKLHQIGGQVDLSVLANGTYIVNTWQNGEVRTERVVKR